MRAPTPTSALGTTGHFINRVNHDKDTFRRWQSLQMFAIAAVIVYLIWLLSPVLMPFAVAAMLAYLGDPLADRLERLG
jgi:predicted PurR-regulated permease PerM